MLSSPLLPPATTRRWPRPTARNSNLHNSLGRSCEIYHAGQSAIAPTLDIFVKTGEVESYSSYLRLSPDVDAGFAILAHDASAAERAADLNVYADVVADGLESLVALAAEQAVARDAGVYRASSQDIAEFKARVRDRGLW